MSFSTDILITTAFVNLSLRVNETTKILTNINILRFKHTQTEIPTKVQNFTVPIKATNSTTLNSNLSSSLKTN